jgi:hypothetical protein
MMRQTVSRYGHTNKAADSQDIQACHRVRDQLRGERTVVIDQFESDQDAFMPLSQETFRKLVETLAEPNYPPPPADPG